MKTFLQSFTLLLVALMIPETVLSDVVQLADGVYRDGTTLYIASDVTSLDALNVNPSVIYSFAAVPPKCVGSTFSSYDATLHIPPASYGAYFISDFWGNFENMFNDAVEPTSIELNNNSANIIVGETLSLTATVFPNNASDCTVVWSSTNPSVATVNGGVVTAQSVGECDIVASCLNLNALCHVTVSKTTIHITLDKHEARLLPNHSLTITPTMSPMMTSLKVTVSDAAVAAARLINGVVQVVGLTEGTTMIVVSSIDDQAVPDTCMIRVYTEMGDINCDGFVNINDVTAMVNYLMGGDSVTINTVNADTNRDSVINIKDVTSLISYLMSGSIWPWYEPEYETFIVGGVSFKMITVDGGTFTMGASDNDVYAGQERPVHQVTLSSFAIGETEVTQALWLAVMGENPSLFSNRNSYIENLNRPVECVSWNDCQTFITRLNEITGKRFRLPSEAEWEYSARGGKLNRCLKYAGSDSIEEVAWYYENSCAPGINSPDYGTHAVSTKAANELGLYDISGNVLEWCQDWYSSYSESPQTNPAGPTSGLYRIARGGCWRSEDLGCGVSVRYYGDPSFSDNFLGFRLAL